MSTEDACARLKAQVAGSGVSLQDLFNQFDAKGEGFISRSAFKNGLIAFGFAVDDEQRHGIRKAIDVSGDKKIWFEEWTAFFAAAASAEPNQYPSETSARKVASDSEAPRGTNAAVLSDGEGAAPRGAGGAPREDAAGLLVQMRVKAHETGQTYEAIFQSFNKAGDGNISRGEFKKGLVSLGLTLTDEDRKLLRKAFDKNNTKKVVLPEWIEVLSAGQPAAAATAAAIAAAAAALAPLASVPPPAAAASPETNAGGRGASASPAAAGGRWAESYTVSYQQGAVGMSFGQVQDGTYVVARSTSQSEALGVRVGDRIGAVNGTPVRNDMDTAEVLELIRSAPRPFGIQLQRQRSVATGRASPGPGGAGGGSGKTPDPSPSQPGVRYSVTYGQGKVGMSFGQQPDGSHIVLKATGQSEELKVSVGDQILAVNGAQLNPSLGTAEVLALIRSAPRPFAVLLERPSVLLAQYWKQYQQQQQQLEVLQAQQAGAAGSPGGGAQPALHAVKGKGLGSVAGSSGLQGPGLATAMALSAFTSPAPSAAAAQLQAAAQLALALPAEQRGDSGEQLGEELLEAVELLRVKSHAMCTTISAAFDLFDSAGKGTISRTDFKQGLERLGMQLEDSTRHTLRKMIDTDGTKKITYSQWEAFMNVQGGPFDKRNKTPTNAAQKKLRGMSNPNTSRQMSIPNSTVASPMPTMPMPAAPTQIAAGGGLVPLGGGA
jgi:Ca2+-binding EF-hand superfamily protein